MNWFTLVCFNRDRKLSQLLRFSKNLTKINQRGQMQGEPAICQCCKMSMMQNDNDAKCQWYIYVNVAKCQCLQNDNIKNRKCSATIPTLP